jgi:hypothetical protein
MIGSCPTPLSNANTAASQNICVPGRVRRLNGLTQVTALYLEEEKEMCTKSTEKKKGIFENVALEMFGGSGMAGDHNLFASGQ